MKDENNTPQPWIDPALEARIVASVLGETSAFEAAEIERLVAANPELALFKRRIEAAHGHLKAASEPENPKLQLSPERRRKLLETIGVPAVAPPKKVHVIATPTAWWSSPLMVRAAACLIMIGLAVALLSSVTDFRQTQKIASSIEGYETEYGNLPQNGTIITQGLVTSTADMQFEFQGGSFVPKTPMSPALPAAPQAAAAGEAYNDEGHVVFRKSGDGAIALNQSPVSSTTPVLGDVPLAGRLFKESQGVALGNVESNKNREPTADQSRSHTTYTGELEVGEVLGSAKPAATPLELAKADEKVQKRRSVILSDEDEPVKLAATAATPQANAEYIQSNDTIADRALPAPNFSSTPVPANEKTIARLADTSKKIAGFRNEDASGRDGVSGRGNLREEILEKQEQALVAAPQQPKAALDGAASQLAQQYGGEAGKDLKASRDKLQESLSEGYIAIGGLEEPATTLTDFETGSAQSLKDRAAQTVPDDFAVVAEREAARRESKADANKVAAASKLSEAKPEEGWNSLYMYRGVNVLEAGQSLEAAKAPASKPQAALAALEAIPADEMQELTTQLQEKETLIEKLQNDVDIAHGRADKSNDVAQRQATTEALSQSADLQTRLSEQETIIAKLQSELDGTKGMAKSMAKVAPAARALKADSPESEDVSRPESTDNLAEVTAVNEVPAGKAISANSIDALLAGVSGNSDPASQPVFSVAGVVTTPNIVNQPVFGDRNGQVEFDGFINYGNPIEVQATDEVKKARAKQLIDDGERFQESGRFDLAQKRFEQSLQIDKSNPEARRGIEQAKVAKAENAEYAYEEAKRKNVQSVDIAWARPIRRFQNGRTTSTAMPPNPATESVTQKLNNIIIPNLDLREVTPAEAIAKIKEQAAKGDLSGADPSHGGVNIDLQLPSSADHPDTKLTLALTDVPLWEALRYVTELSGMKTKITPQGVAVVPLSDTTTDLVTKEYNISPGVLKTLQFANSKTAKALPFDVRDHLSALGVHFPSGAAAKYIPGTNKLIVRNTPDSLEVIDTLVDAAVQPPAQAFGNEIATSKEPFSTFSLHVSDVSFQLAKDALARGAMPDPSRIRAEEFYNAFDYNDPAPGSGEEVACRIEQSAHPFLQQRNLARIAVKVAAAGRAAGQPLRLTVLLDTSGSMEREDRAASVRRALQSLVSLLGPNDRVTLIGFARTPRLLAENVPGDQGQKLIEEAGRTPSQGGTNLEEALALASELALKNREPKGQNRIVLLTDGAANLGNANPERLAQQIDKTRQQGISFDACGVGAKGLNDEILEALTRKGDGRYYFLNKPEDADEGFARQLAGAFRPAAENVKVQVVFNPARVASYRLIGFEKHLLEKEDFRNDKVQAAELSAEEAGVALYQIQPLPEGTGELGEVFVRFRDPATGRMVERSWTIPYDEQVPSFDQASPSLQLAATAALLAEKLGGNEQIDLDTLAPVLNGLRGRYGEQQRVGELLRMFEQVRR